MMMEMMGLHIPGAAFVNPGTATAELTRAAIHRVAEVGWDGNDYRPLGRVIDEKGDRECRGRPSCHRRLDQSCDSFAGNRARRGDMDRLGRHRPAFGGRTPYRADLSQRFGDVNDFQAAGGMAFTIATLLDAGLLHRDILTVGARAFEEYAQEPKLNGDVLVWEHAPRASRDETMLRSASSRSIRMAACASLRQPRPRDLQNKCG